MQHGCPATPQGGATHVAPTHIMLDLDHNKAYWFSAYGEQSIDLDQPLHRPAQNITSVPDWLIAVSRATAPAAGPSPEMVPIPSG